MMIEVLKSLPLNFIQILDQKKFDAIIIIIIIIIIMIIIIKKQKNKKTPANSCS